MAQNHIWEFTNQRKLNKKDFITYFEKKVFKTIRKYEMLPKTKIFKIKKQNDVNTIILKKILETKFQVKYSKISNISSENSSDAAEQIFQNILQGKFKGPSPKDKISRPLYFHSDKEIEVYSKLTQSKGAKPKRNKKVQNLFKKFLNKNQDLELNITKALEQIKT